MSKINAAMFGILTAAAASWEGYDNDTQRRLRNLRNDASDALEQIRDYMSRGEQIRGRLPSVMDALLGLALANPTQTTPEILPTSTKLSRPVIDESSVSDLSWPLKTGTYDSKGRVTELGDLSRTFLALTFQELRAFIEGAAQEKSPSQAGLTQINRAANQLISVLSTLNLTAAQYKTVWTQLFNGSSNPSTDPHLGTPTIGAPIVANNVASVGFIVGSTKTDRAMRIRWQHWCGQRHRDHHVRLGVEGLERRSPHPCDRRLQWSDCIRNQFYGIHDSMLNAYPRDCGARLQHHLWRLRCRPLLMRSER